MSERRKYEEDEVFRRWLFDSLSVVLSAPSNVIYAFAEEYIDESESVDYEQSNLIENEESVENNQSDVKISEEVSSEEVSSEESIIRKRIKEAKNKKRLRDKMTRVVESQT